MIIIVWGPPREGKNYYTTKWALNEMGKKKGKTVISNYPIYHPKKGYCYQWDPLYAKMEVTDSIIFIDEAYRNYNSRNYKDFSPEEHTFFATNGHNGNDIILCTQNPARIELIIREMTNVFYHVRKHPIPFTQYPLWFTIEGFTSELDMARRFSEGAVYSREQVLFRKNKIAKAYNHKYFRIKGKKPDLKLWDVPRPPEKPHILKRVCLTAANMIHKPGRQTKNPEEINNIDVVPDSFQCFGSYGYEDLDFCKACQLAAECYEDTNGHV